MHTGPSQGVLLITAIYFLSHSARFENCHLFQFFLGVYSRRQFLQLYPLYHIIGVHLKTNSGRGAQAFPKRVAPERYMYSNTWKARQALEKSATAVFFFSTRPRVLFSNRKRKKKKLELLALPLCSPTNRFWPKSKSQACSGQREPLYVTPSVHTHTARSFSLSLSESRSQVKEIMKEGKRRRKSWFLLASLLPP